jgi:AraC family transcriptional regulator
VFIMFGQTGLRLSRFAPSSVMPPHDHEYASLNIVVGGDITEKIGRGERRYVRGHASFCPAGVVHSQDFGASGARQIIFRPQDAWLDYLADCKLDLSASPFAGSMVFQQLGDRLRDEMQSDDAFSAMAREGIMLEIVAAFGRSGTAPASVAEPPAWLRRARAFLHENVSSSLSMTRIAQAAGRHEIHLAREFKRFFGLSVGNYLRRLRTERAAMLLAQSRTDLTDIALACGFSSHSHLCREFKARYGVTPSQYRARRN